jgi:alternate signal-mediated exported protein
MNNLTKGALATGAAAVLLLGGTSTLAYWSDSDSVDGGQITTGYLRIDAVGCDTNWVYANGTDAGTTVGEIVPGDAITKTCTFDIDALGDHLSAVPDVDETLTYTSNAPTPNTLTLPVTATYELDGVAFGDSDRITEDDNGSVLSAEILVTFPFGNTTTINENTTQDLTIALDDLTVSLVQDGGTVPSPGENPNA